MRRTSLLHIRISLAPVDVRDTSDRQDREYPCLPSAVVLPLHHPLIVAEEIATADMLSGGRLNVSLCHGDKPYEFERLGQTLEKSRRRFEESVDILPKAFIGEPLSYDGKYKNFSETSIFPAPIQRPRPPI